MGRRVITKALVMAGLVAASIPVLSSPAAACSCIGLTDSEAFDAADAVFTAELLEVRTPGGEIYSSADPERFIFAVDRVYKGDVRATQSVVTAREGASCGLELSGRGPFVVFARTGADGLTADLEDGEVSSGLCSGSRALEDRAIPPTFGSGEPPVAGESPVGAADDRDSALLAMLAGATGLTVLALVALFVVRRRRWTPRPTPA